MFNITEFNIYGLHGDKDIKVKLEDSALILVGENGAYKTTIVSLFYGLLDYNRVFLDKYSYKRLEVVIDGTKFCYDYGVRPRTRLYDTDLYKSYYPYYITDSFLVKGENLDWFLQRDRFESVELLDALCSVCNKYLVDKELVHVPETGDAKFLHLREKKDGVGGIVLGKPVNHYHLSDAELKILYIFFKLYLNDVKLFLVIDEIERGLSVEWQETILEDIKKAPSFAGMVVTTHSPFVFSNSLRKYAHGVGSFLYKKENK
jgi:energy-coupling factor transporter ATP-binding protein EcfA2